jgi:hypothetical protein
MRGARSFSAISVATGVIVLSLVASASAATISYRNDTTVFDPVNFFTPGVSQVTVPGGRTPVAKLEIQSVKLAAGNGDGDDADLTLTGPAGTTPPFDLVSDECVEYSSTQPLDFTDSAANTVGFSNCSGPVKPEDPRTLALFNGGPSSGTWTATIDDDDNAAMSDVSFFGWGLRITHAPFVFTVKAKKQPLRRKVKLSASCNAKCTITSSGDVKSRSLVQAKDVNVKFKLPLKARAFERLEDGGGKAKFTLVASDGYGDLSTQKVKVRFPG